MGPTDVQQPLDERRIKRIRARNNMEGRFKEMRDTPELGSRLLLWGDVVERIGAETPVALLEFGVFEGRSIRFWSTNFIAPETRIHGFDSFTGLPEDWTGKMVKGTFSTGGSTPIVDDPRVDFHRGWIQNTLPPFIKSFETAPGQALVVHIDVDLYSAALFIISTLWHYVDSYYIIFDEFGVDENLAFMDFLTAYPIDFEFYSHTFNQQYNLPQQVFGRITRTVYAV